MNHRQRGLKVIGILAVTILLLTVLAPAMAAPCSEFGTPGSVNITVPKMVVSQTTAVGAVLAEVTSVQPTYGVQCTTANNFMTTTFGEPLRGEIMKVLDDRGEPIPGLGMRLKMSTRIIRDRFTGACTGGNQVTLDSRSQFVCQFSVTSNGVPIGFSLTYGRLTLTFFKTGPELASAKMGAQTVLTLRTDTYTSIPYRITSGEVSVNPCTFGIPHKVSLGSMSATAMNNGESSSPATILMNVNCLSSAKYKVRFAPAGGSTAVTGVPGALSNSATSATAARNVNVQLQNVSDQPIELNKDIDHGEPPANSFAIYRVRMVRNGTGTVEPGEVAAAAQVSFTFY